MKNIVLQNLNNKGYKCSCARWWQQIGIGLLMVLFVVSHGYAEVNESGQHGEDCNNLFGSWSCTYYYGDTGSGSIVVNAGSSKSYTGYPSEIWTMYLGKETNGSGTATITGPGSTWNLHETLLVGNSGTGELRILNSGSANIGHRVWIAVDSDGVGTIEVRETGSNLSMGNHLYVARRGTGELNILAGGSVSVEGDTKIGVKSGSNGTITVNGNGSILDNDNQTVGLYGTGDLSILDGGQVSSTGGSSLIAHESGSVGIVNVNGDNSIWTTLSPLYIGGDDTSSGGTATLTIEDNGLVDVSSTTKVWETGSLIINETGQLSTNTLNLTDAGSTKSKIEVSLGGEIPSTSDGLISAGSSIALAGDFEVTLPNNNYPNGPTSFQIFNAPSISGSFSPYTLPGLNTGLEWDDSQLNITGILSVTSSSSSVPEPTTTAAMIIGGLVLGGSVLRKKKNKI